MRTQLSLANAEDPAGDTPIPGVELPGASMRSGVHAPRPAVVLAVDDDPSVLLAVRRVLVTYGYTVLEAGGGEEALQVARDNAERIDVVFTDVRMPGLDGPSLVRQLAGVLPVLRVVYTSGNTEGRLEHELPAPNRTFLAKPFTVERLTRTLADILAP